MALKIKNFLNLYWLPVLICVILLATISGCRIFQRWAKPNSQDGVTTPPLVDSPNETTEGVQVEGDIDGNGDENGDGDGDEAGFSIQLSEGQSQPQQVEPIPLATGEPLSDEDIEPILARLPTLEVEAGDQQDFKLPDESLPPPRTGETVDHTFPSPEGDLPPEEVESGALEVLRHAPEGEIPIAPFVNITFNQPMVPLTSIEDLAAGDVPVILEPDIPGTWRWIGTKTLTFEYDSELIDRLPMATEFQVTVPKGTESATGGVLQNAVSWAFSTPPVQMINYYPTSQVPQPLDPIFFIAFDQRIDPQDVLKTITVTADGKEVNTVLLNEDQIKEDEQVSRLVENTGEGRWLAFRAKELLPADALVYIVIGPDTPSAEGPLLTQKAQSYEFYTYAPLRIEEHGCSWTYDDECRPLEPFYIWFNNPIDVDKYDDNMLTIEPALPGATVSIYGNTINIKGITEGRTTYRITVDETITDVFGQTLGKDERLTFRVGQSEPILVGPDEILVTLDPASDDPVLSLYAINYKKLDVQIYAVEPSDWPDFKEYLREYERTDVPLKPPGRLVHDKTLKLDTPADTLTEVNVELSSVMDGSYGQFIVIVKPPTSLFADERYWETVQAWVQVTQIGLDAFADHSEMVAWASALADGAPLSDVSILTDKGNKAAVTGADGIARFDLSSTGTTYLVAEQGDDQAILPRSVYLWGDDSWDQIVVHDTLRWYVFDDRHMYKPDEEVHVKGWIRRVGGKQDGDVGLVGNALQGVRYTIMGPQGNELGTGSAEANDLGGFDFVFTLPENANLGYAELILNTEGNLGSLELTQYYHAFQIQEFRRPEFEVTARNETTGPYFLGDQAVVAVEAKYYAGGPLPNAEVNWYIYSSPTSYTPPNWSGFVFGVWTPWWWYYESDYDDSSYQTFTSKTDATGNHYLHMDFNTGGEKRPVSVQAEATVMDVNRQAWTGSTSLMVHPADLYVGLHSERYFVERGTPIDIDLIVTDLDGNPVTDRQIKVKAVRLEWKFSKGEWRQEETDPQECTVGSQDEPVTCTFETNMGGRYQITAVVTDEMGRQNKSQFTRWVSGGQQPPSREVEHETVTLIPDRETYQPGDVAQILVQSPFSPAEGLLTVSRSGILYTERFLMDEDSTTLEVPIDDKHIPNLHIQVDVMGSAPRSDDQGEIIEEAPPRPAYATGQLQLSIPPLQRTLALEVTPQHTELEPGGETTISAVLKDSGGQPVADAELAVVVVDEAILALSNYVLTDPVTVFYAERPSDLSSRYSRSSIVLANPDALTAAAETEEIASTQVAEKEMMIMEEAEGEAMMEAPAAAPMEGAADNAGRGSATEPIRVRSDFNPLATFSPTVRTDDAGKAIVPVTLPDNLTRYRIMVVAVDEEGAQYGSAEANLTARLPLMVRPSAPRFLNFGDKFELPVVLQNQTDEPMTAEVVVQASNTEFTEDIGQKVTIPARDRVEVRFPATTVMAGTARFQIAAVSGGYADAASVELPVYTPATTEAFATYGVIDEGAIAQPIASPSNVFSQFGGLEITTSSTALQALTDAVLYLVSYPYDCSEQMSSRILAIAALREVLTAFEAEGLPSPEAMEQSVINDIDRLAGLQNYDGGFPYWRRGWDSVPYNTVHIAHALQRARMMGFEVPEYMQNNVHEYLIYIEDHYPYWYTEQIRWTISSYALYVRHLMGDSDPDKARRLLEEAGLENLSLEAVAWIWQVLVDTNGSDAELEAIRRHINNRAVETAGAANFTTSYGDDAYLLLHSNRRTDAVILDALIADNPQSDLIPKVVNGLLAHRKKGHWSNTQENVFVLLALDRYFKTYESQTPDFVARIWLGETYAGSHEYVGRTTERHQTDIPMVYLTDEALAGGETQDLIISKDGVGRLYYRLGLRYAPTDLEMDPLDMGFVVQRSYEAVDDPEDVHRDSDGIWHIKAGARVRVRLTMVADNRRYHVALVDPLPAGLEIINPDLAVSGSVPQDPNSEDYRYGWWWWWPWYEHQNMRDEQVEAFTSLLWDGVYTYTYEARATTPGTFVVPPAKAEEMYSPEVFGRSGSDFVIVE